MTSRRFTITSFSAGRRPVIVEGVVFVYAETATADGEAGAEKSKSLG